MDTIAVSSLETANPGVNTDDATPDSYSLWSEREVERIEALSDHQVITELHQIMIGDNYSWHRINQLLQGQLDEKVIEFTVEGGDVIFEWNNLCDERREWEKSGRLSVCSAEFNRDCLINLKILPIRGGMGNEGRLPDPVTLSMLIILGLRLVTTNADEPDLLTKNLGVEPIWEGLSSYESADSLTEDGGSSRLRDDSDESEYEDDGYGIMTYSSDEEVQDDEGSLSSPLTQDDTDEHEPEANNGSGEGQDDEALLISPFTLDEAEFSESEDTAYEPISSDDSEEDMEEKTVSTML